MPEENWERVDRSKRFSEWSTFLFVALIVLPGLAVAFVGGYGLIVWVMQMIYGPPIVG